ncbi:unnamed protein product [Angiostrongylus costaricensis]|uniref:Protein kinase domain-containing protein n=1 Tax=Angiostrongylus costaricensis TaxID=334426 RepID=A0A0R3PP96_ANGCS|nr:unnamed protein product [Angiostrongylus costaricensis]
MRQKRADGITTDYDVYRMNSFHQIGGQKIRERLPKEKREAVLRLCRFDSDIDHKVFKHEYSMFKMLARSYTNHACRIRFPAILGRGYLGELRYLDIDDDNRRHPDIIERPQIPRPYFILEMVGPTVETFFKSDRNKHLPVHTSLFLTIGCIQALRLLHLKGFAHRNVQPAYFSIRLPRGILIRRECELCDLVAITELWTCRKYRAHLARLRTGLTYVGNWKYGSVETLSGKAPTAVDDLISCIYMMTEFVLGNVPWHTQIEKQRIINTKKEVERWKNVEDAQHNTLLTNYCKLYEWLHSQPS